MPMSIPIVASRHPRFNFFLYLRNSIIEPTHMQRPLVYLLRIVLTLLLLAPVQASAQYHFRTLNSDDGLLSNLVRTVVRDKEGYTWIGSRAGLQRFDGYTLKSYLVGDQHPDVTAIAQDGNGCLWVTTYGDRALLYDARHDSLTTNISPYLNSLGIHLPDRPERVLVDEEGELWLIGGGRLHYFSFSAHSLYSIPLPDSIGVARLSCRAGAAFVASARGDIYQVSPAMARIRFVAALPSMPQEPFSTYLDTHNSLYLYGRYLPTLYKLNTQTLDLDSLHIANVTAITEDHAGALWVGTNSDGITIVRPSQTLTRVTVDSPDSYPLPSNHINSLFIDDQDIVWVGTSKVGVAYSHLGSAAISCLGTPFKEDIAFFQTDALGHLWVGYDGAGLLMLDSAMNAARHYTTGNSALQSNLVITAMADVDNTILLGTYGGGVYRMAPNAQPRRIFRENRIFDYVRRIARDKEGNLWIATVKDGLVRIAPNDSLTIYNCDNSPMRTNAITDMAVSARDSTIYVGTSTGLCIVGTAGCISLAEHVDSLGNDLGRLNISTLCVDAYANLYLCTPGGLLVYDHDLRLLRSFGDADGMARPLGIVTDRNGSVWLTNSQGITAISVACDSARHFSFRTNRLIAEDGLADVAFCSKAICCLPQGDILAGGVGRMVHISPQATPPLSAHKVYFTSAQIAGREVVPYDTLRLEHSDDIALSLSTLNFVRAAKPLFLFRIGDTEWRQVAANVIHLYNLGSGNNLLQVKVLDQNAQNAHVASLLLVVAPPFYLSPYAIALYLIVILAIVVIILRHRHANQPTPVASPTDADFVARATEAVEVRIDNQEFSVEDLAQALCMSRSALYKRLLAATGKAPLDFIRSIRLQRALRLLEDPNLSISEVAWRVGLSPRQFSRLFKEAYGYPPSQGGHRGSARG